MTWEIQSQTEIAGFGVLVNVSRDVLRHSSLLFSSYVWDLLEQTEKNHCASETQTLFIDGREILIKTHGSWKWEMKRVQEYWATERLFPSLDSGWVFGSAEWNVNVYYWKIFVKRPTSSAGPKPDAHSCFCLSIPLASAKKKYHEVIYCYSTNPLLPSGESGHARTSIKCFTHTHNKSWSQSKRRHHLHILLSLF